MWAWLDKDVGWRAEVDGDGEERGGSCLFVFPFFCSIPFSRYLCSYARQFLGCPVMDMGF